MKLNRLLLATSLIGVLAAGCVQSDGGPVASASNITAAEVLWLPAEAVLQRDATRPVLVEKGRSIYVDGSGAVAFGLIGEREDVVRRFVERFAETQWRQRSTQYLNPQLRTSFSDGWRPSGGLVKDSQGVTNPVDTVYTWHGEWEDAGGSIVTYDLRAAGKQLRGYAAYVPRKVVELSRQQLAK